MSERPQCRFRSGCPLPELCTREGYCAAPSPTASPAPARDVVVPRVHCLKTWPKYFQAVRVGLKPFEIRKNDRDYQVGDRLLLEEYDPANGGYTGDTIARDVTYVLPGGGFGLAENMCVMGLAAAPAQPAPEVVEAAQLRLLQNLPIGYRDIIETEFAKIRAALRTASPSAPPAPDAVVEAARAYEREFYEGNKYSRGDARGKLFDALAEYDRTSQPGAQGGREHG